MVSAKGWMGGCVFPANGMRRAVTFKQRFDDEYSLKTFIPALACARKSAKGGKTRP